MNAKVDPVELDALCASLRAHGVSILELSDLYPRLERGDLRGKIVTTPAGEAALVLQESGKWRQLVLGRGEPAAVLAAVNALRESSDALLWAADDVNVDGPTLDANGFHALTRQVFTQDLAKVPRDFQPAADLEIAPLKGAAVADARSLFAQTHASSAEGLYCTWPVEPTVRQCGVVFERFLSGADGAPVPGACVVVLFERKVVGVIVCAETEKKGTATLLGLAVDPKVRGRGLSRVLVRHAQRALFDAGFARMLFLTTDANAPVQRLFTPEEIISTETSTLRLWLRNPQVRTEKPR
ncbi:MAG: GNAT family N-acetyltransferase [Archangium sp.]